MSYYSVIEYKKVNIYRNIYDLLSAGVIYIETDFLREQGHLSLAKLKITQLKVIQFYDIFVVFRWPSCLGFGFVFGVGFGFVFVSGFVLILVEVLVWLGFWF